MSFALTSKQYMEYMEKAAARIAACGDYVTALDAETGDGDHWVNLNKGLQQVIANKEVLSSADIKTCLKKIGMTMMSSIGGSSGVLYGSAYIAAANGLAGDVLDAAALCEMLSGMANEMMKRGNSQPGYKTMIDAIYPAAQAYRNALDKGLDDREALAIMKKAAVDGAEKTREMEAVRGRASYMLNKGVGHLDPGAVTMAYQLECLADYIVETAL